MKTFLERIAKEYGIQCGLQEYESIEIEKTTKNNRRMDIVLSFENQKYILIENKIDADNQAKQIYDYVWELQNSKNPMRFW